MVSNFVANARDICTLMEVHQLLPHCIKFSHQVLPVESQGSSEMLNNVNAVTLNDNFLNLIASGKEQCLVQRCVSGICFRKHRVWARLKRDGYRVENCWDRSR